MTKQQRDSIKHCQETIQIVIDELRNYGLPDFNLNRALSNLTNIAKDSSYEWWYDLKIGDTVCLSKDQTQWRIISIDPDTIKVECEQSEGVLSFPGAFEFKLLDEIPKRRFI